MIGRPGSAIVLIAALGMGGALAQQTLPTQQGTPPAAQQQAGISAEQAMQIARDEGMVTVEEIDREGSYWEVEGRDAQGREIEVKIDIASGRVLKVERD